MYRCHRWILWHRCDRHCAQPDSIQTKQQTGLQTVSSRKQSCLFSIFCRATRWLGPVRTCQYSENTQSGISCKVIFWNKSIHSHFINLNGTMYFPIYVLVIHSVVSLGMLSLLMLVASILFCGIIRCKIITLCFTEIFETDKLIWRQVCIHFHIHRIVRRNSRLPPGPRGLPFIGNAHQVIRH